MRLTERSGVRGLAALTTVVLLAAAASPCAAQSQGITLTEVIQLRRSGVSNRQILRSATEYCRAFNVTDEVVGMLRTAGSDDALIAGLRAACSVAPPEPVPGTILDVDFASDSLSGTVAEPDRQCVVRYEARGLLFDNKRRQGGCIISYPSDSLASAVRMQLSVFGLGRRNSGSVIFGFGRATSEPRYYAVEIDAERRLALCQYTRASCARVLYRPLVNAIHTQSDSVNTLEVVVRGREIELRINDEQIAAYTAPAPVSGHLLLGVGPYSSVVLTRLLVRDITRERTTATKRD